MIVSTTDRNIEIAKMEKRHGDVSDAAKLFLDMSIAEVAGDMHNKQDIQLEIEMIIREMAQCIISQSDLDNRLARLDKRRAALEKELKG